MAIFFVQELRLALLTAAAQTGPHRPQVVNKANNGQVVPYEKTKAFPFFVNGRAECRHFKACPQEVSHKYSSV